MFPGNPDQSRGVYFLQFQNEEISAFSLYKQGRDKEGWGQEIQQSQGANGPFKKDWTISKLIAGFYDDDIIKAYHKQHIFP